MLVTLFSSLVAMAAFTGVKGLIRQQNGVREYCSREMFEITCNEGEVISMKSAIYGRMRAGLCISGMSIGCSADVLAYMDTICSGRQSCRLEVNDLDKIVQPCSRDFKSYLEAEHTCIKAVEAKDCWGQEVVRLKKAQGYIVGNPTLMLDSKHAPQRCSFNIKVQEGQKINLYLYNFALHPSRIGPIWPQGRSSGAHGRNPSKTSPSASCSGFITIQDSYDQKRRIDLCTDVFSERQNLVFTSIGNELTVYTVLRRSDKKHSLLMRYTAIGCPDLDPPISGWIERRKDDAVVRCNTSGDVWYMTCQDNEWIGQYGNCSEAAYHQPLDVLFGEGIPFQQGLALAVGVGVVVGTILGAILLVCVYTIRKGRRESLAAERRAEQQLQSGFPRYVDEERSNYPALLGQDKNHDGSFFEYTHVWDVRTQALEKKKDANKATSPFSGANVTIETALPARVHFDAHSHRKCHLFQPPGGECKVEECKNKTSCEHVHTPVYFDLDPDAKFELERNSCVRPIPAAVE